MPSMHLRCCHILPSGLHWQWLFFPWSRTRSSVSHLWGKGGVSAKMRRRLTGHIWKESRSSSWSSELCSGPRRLKYKSHKRTDRWLLPWESGSHASPKHLRRWLFNCTSTWFLRPCLHGDNNRRMVPFTPLRICCLVGRQGCGRKGGICYDSSYLLDLINQNHGFLARWKAALTRASFPLVNLLTDQEVKASSACHQQNICLQRYWVKGLGVSPPRYPPGVPLNEAPGHT